jgi:hypothetical protein
MKASVVWITTIISRKFALIFKGIISSTHTITRTFSWSFKYTNVKTAAKCAVVAVLNLLHGMDATIHIVDKR